jgi:biopolymer transport protein TolQ
MNTPPTFSTWSLILDASPLVKLTLLLLVSASVMTWTIIIYKVKRIRSASNADREFLDLFWNAQGLEEISTQSRHLQHSPISQVFDAGYRELKKLPAADRTADGAPEITNIDRALNRSMAQQIDELEHSVDWLATTASAAPFVGLFGTVWGIMNSFQNIGATGAASLAVVAPGISEALIATAIGLGAAIPAAIGYNFLVVRIRKIALNSESFSQEFLNMVQRSLLSTRKEPV